MLNRDKNNLLEKVKKNLKQYLQNWKIDINEKKRQNLCQKKVKTFVLNGHHAMPVNPTHIYIYALKHVDV